MKLIQVVPLILVVFLPISLFADQMDEPAARTDSEIDHVNKASDASFDKRLPPVLPGEEVRDGGKKMKVWSTSGPVSVNPEVPHAPAAPEPWRVDGTSLGPVGVIVDQRHDSHNGHGNGK